MESLPNLAKSSDETITSSSSKTIPTHKFSFGQQGNKPGEFGELYGITSDSVGNIYTADSSNNRIQKFDPNGNFLTSFQVQGDKDFQGIYPIRSIIIDNNGDLLVTLPLDNKMIKYNSDGKVVTDFLISIKNGFNDITVDRKNNIYITGSGETSIQKFEPNGKLITFWGGSGDKPGWFSGITGIVIDSQDNIYAVGHEYNRIQKFTSEGEFLDRWGELEDEGPGKFESLISIDIDSEDNVYVLDQYGSQNIQKFNSDGQYIGTIGKKGSGLGGFSNPSDISIDLQNNIYVADRGNHRIHVFGY